MRVMLIAAASLLASCSTWQKPGASEQQFYSELGQCEQQAHSMYPVSMQSMGSGYQMPTRTTCTGYGPSVNCTTMPGAYTPPPQSDVNVFARNQAIDRCLMSKGWSKSR